MINTQIVAKINGEELTAQDLINKQSNFENYCQRNAASKDVIQVLVNYNKDLAAAIILNVKKQNEVTIFKKDLHEAVTVFTKSLKK